MQTKKRICYNDNSCDGFYITDICNNKITCEYDDRFSEITGYNSLAEIAGRDLVHLIHPDDVEKFKAAKKSVSKQNPFESINIRLIKKDNSILYVKCSLIYTITEDNYERIIHAFSILNDSAYIKQHEELFYAMPPIMFKFHIEARFPYYYNESFLKVIGYTKEELQIKNLSYTDIMDPDDIEHFIHAVKNSIRSNTISACTFKIKDKKGQAHWISCSFKKITTSSGAVYFIGMGNDISEQKKIESDLYWSHMLIQGMTNNMSYAAFRLNHGSSDLEILHFNEGFKNIFGYSGKDIDLFSKDICKLIIHPDDYELFMNRLRISEPGVTAECRAVRNTSETIWVSFCSSKVSEGGHTCYICTFQDISKEKLLENELSVQSRLFTDMIAYTSRVSFTIDYTDDTISFSDVFVKKHSLPPVIRNMPEGIIKSGFIPDDFKENFLKLYYDIKAGAPEASSIIKLKEPNMRSSWSRITLTAIPGSDDKPVKAIGIMTDVSNQILAEEKFASEENNTAPHSGKSIMLCMVNLSQSRVLVCRSRNSSVINVPEQMIYDSDFISSFIANVHPDERIVMSERLSVKNLWSMYLGGADSSGFEYRIKSDDGSYIWVKAEMNFMREQVTDDIILTINLYDISPGKETDIVCSEQNDLHTTSKVLTKTLFRLKVNDFFEKQHSNELFHALYLLDLNGFRNINKNFGYDTGDKVLCAIAEELMKTNSKAVIGRIYGDEFLIFISDIKSYDELNINARTICSACKKINVPGIDAEALSGCVGVAFSPANGSDFDSLYGKADSALYNAKRFDRNRYAIYSEADRIKSEEAIGGSEEISRKKNIYTIANSMSLDEFKKEASSKIIRTDKKYHLYNVDIKKFRNINHFFGYEKGDMILRDICIQLSEFLREGEFFTRIFADNFLILTIVKDENEVEERMTEISARLDNLPLTDEHKIEFSAGIVTIDDSNRNTEFEHLIDCAIVARQNAKKSKNTSYVYFEPGMTDDSLKKYEILSELKSAIKLGQICTYVQPQYDIIKREYVSMEALVRWNHPTKGLLSPDKFISICEENGFISKIDFCVLEQMCSYIKNRIAQNLHVLPVAINQSQITIHESGYFKRITSLIEKYGIPPEYIELEVTESAYVNNFEETIGILTRLKDYGFRISMDDFGTGYSTLNLLKDIPVDVLKIDRGFLTKKLTEKKTKEIIKSITNMAHNINMRVVCEGVEFPQQLPFLEKIGCELVQGYLFGKPMPYEEVASFIETSSPVT